MKIGNIPQVKPLTNTEIKPTTKAEGIEITNDNVPDSSPEIKVAASMSKKEIDDSLLDKSVDQANKSLKQYHRVIERDVHEVTKAVMYTVKDTDTNEVIAEFPPRKIQDMIAKMWELAGLVVDEKA